MPLCGDFEKNTVFSTISATILSHEARFALSSRLELVENSAFVMLNLLDGPTLGVHQKCWRGGPTSFSVRETTPKLQLSSPKIVLPVRIGHQSSRWCRMVMLLWFISGAFSLAQAGLFQRTAEEPGDTEAIVLVQIYLDELLLGPGKIDGKLGEFTRTAFQHYNQRWRQAPDNWYRILREAGRQVKTPYQVYTVQQRDFQYVGPLPTEPSEQAKLKYLPYRTIEEFVAERFHTDEPFLRKLNPGRNLALLREGQSLNVPNVTPFEISAVKNYQKFEEEESLSSRLAYVDTSARVAKIFDRGNLVASFPITPGAKKFIPYGDWKLTTMVTTPEFRWDQKMLEEGQRGEDFHQLPPGPNSPVGIFWAGLSKSGIGLHGTSSPHTIGRSQSAGCIRLANWDAIRLSDVIRPGATVLVR